MDTIFAQSSALGKAGVAVFRISGPKSLFALKKLVCSEEFHATPRMMSYQKLISPLNNEFIDNAMVVYFKAPHSFTGEDVVEIHTHGSRAIAVILTSALLNIDGIRLAEAGEFARRAFLNEKFDLTAAEGLADLIEAETLLQHRQATRQANGALEILYSEWRQKLLTIISLLEAYIDFPDEDIPDSILKQVEGLKESLCTEIMHYLNDNRRGELLRSGIKLAILGPPNVGKSSLLNFLLQRDISIVSNIPGTTRDIIEGHLDIGGYPVILQDTAGIRAETNDIIEQEGIKRALASAHQADIKIIILDVQDLDQLTIVNSRRTTSNDVEQFKSIDYIYELIDENSIVLINKIDLVPSSLRGAVGDAAISKNNYLYISIKEKIGLDKILQQIEQIAEKIAGLTETPSITRERHRSYLKHALEHLNNFNINNDLVLATEDIRLAARSISTITGKISVDEILGEIFSNFCIGK